MATIQAVGMIEFNSIAVGIESADTMFKAALVEPLMLKTICPGKYVVAVHSDVAAVQAAIDAGMSAGIDTVVDSFVIPNIDPAVISAIGSAIAGPAGNALGVIETFSAASCIVAADTAVKTAAVDLIEVRIAMGVGGKAFCTLCGDVGPVEMAVSAGAEVASEKGLLVRKTVIPSIAEQVRRHIM
ncbi:MAG: BMC domain-containing protein [Desulfosarcinaceae bacterium]|nr:BMC domain-containing protein [Desulfosarcinaceae bacterium]